MTAFADLVAALRAAELQPTVVDVAEAMWLTQFVDGPVTALPRARADAAIPELAEVGVPPRLPVTAMPAGADPVAAELHPYTTDDDQSSGAFDGVRLRSPGVPALPHALELGRALRSLRRYLPSPDKVDVDEAETADRIAQERLWVPVLRARMEPATDLALIVDSSSSMAVWHPTIRELLLLMQRLGAFRAIRGYSVDSDLWGELALLPLGARVASVVDANAITDPTGRQLMIVVTDGVGEAWHDGRMDAQLQRWGKANRIQVLCVLPRRMWRATGLRTRTADRPDGRIPVPVLELSLSAISRRASKIGQSEGAATLLAPEPANQPETRPTEPGELVRRFLALASPTARCGLTRAASRPLIVAFSSHPLQRIDGSSLR